MEIIYQGTAYTLKEVLPTDKTLTLLVRLYNVAAKYYVEFEQAENMILPTMQLQPNITAKMPIGVYNLEIYEMQLGMDSTLRMHKHIENYAVVKETSMALAQN